MIPLNYHQAIGVHERLWTGTDKPLQGNADGVTHPTLRQFFFGERRCFFGVSRFLAFFCYALLSLLSGVAYHRELFFDGPAVFRRDLVKPVDLFVDFLF